LAQKNEDPTLAEGICDRIVHESYTIVIAGGQLDA